MDLRRFKDSDETRLAQIIRDTWKYEQLSRDPKVTLLMGRIYLYSCLSAQNYNLVAERDGIPVGIIMGYSNGKPDENVTAYEQKLEEYCDEMMQYPDGKFILEIFSGFEKLDKKMLDETGKPYDGELVFFVTDAAVRNEHIGTKLYKSLLIEWNKYNCKRIFVYTDATCNFGFYEHQGFVKVNHKLHDVRGHKMEFYVYEKELA